MIFFNDDDSPFSNFQDNFINMRIKRKVSVEHESQVPKFMSFSDHSLTDDSWQNVDNFLD